MATFQNVLIGFDGSEGAWRALRHGVALALKPGASATAVAVVPRLPPQTPRSTVEATERAIGERLQAAREYARGQGLDLATELRHGHAAGEIVEVARAGDFDLIVVGHTGHSGLWQGLLGTTTDQITRHAPCSVMIVR